jgi:hypothetical protein
MTTLIKERVQQLRSLTLLSGAHRDFEAGACAMEAASWIAGEPWSDHPACVCPIIGAFMRSWNDGIQDNNERTALLTGLIPLTIGTKASQQIEDRRVFMCVDWVVREFTPSWLDVCDRTRYAEHSAALRSLPEISSWQNLIDATPILVDAKNEATAAWDAARDAARAAARAAAWAAARAAAWDAARDAARDAAWDAAWDAARDAAWAAAWDAAWAAAWDAAWAAAWAAAWDPARAAAWDAARDAARDAAWAAAWDALKPATEKLQASAVFLVKRMCEIKDSAA